MIVRGDTPLPVREPVPLTLLTIFCIKSPAPLAVALCVPTIPVILGMTLQMLYLHEYGKSFHRRVSWYVYVIFTVTFLLYQLVLSYAAGQALIWLSVRPEMALAGAALTGFGFSLVYPGFGVEAVLRVPAQSRGLAMGAYTAFLDLAQGLASPALGLLATGATLNVVFLASAVTVLFAALVAAWLIAHPAPMEGSPQ